MTTYLCALVWLLMGVNPYVSYKITRFLELLATVGALVPANAINLGKGNSSLTGAFNSYLPLLITCVIFTFLMACFFMVPVAASCTIIVETRLGRTCSTAGRAASPLDWAGAPEVSVCTARPLFSRACCSMS